MMHSRATDIDLRALRRRAMAAALAGRHRRAAKIYAQLLEANATDADAAFRLGEESRKCGDRLAALRAFHQAAVLFEADGRAPQAEATRLMVIQLRQMPPAPVSWWQRLTHSVF